jgi:hypothetical protein
MPLEASYADIKDWKELHADSDEFSKTEYICLMARQWLLPGITDDNYLEVYIRIHALEIAWDELHPKDKVFPYTTLDQIKRRIGLSFSGRWWGDESAKTWWHKHFHHFNEQVKNPKFLWEAQEECSTCGVRLMPEQVATSQHEPHDILCNACANTEAVEEYYASMLA